jgi:catecholate siderophore receptor
MRRVPWLALLALFVPLVSPAIAQISPVMGTVVDSSHAPVEGARVSAIPDGGGQAVRTATDSHGAFVISLPPGQYTLSIESDGFLPISRRLSAGSDTARQEFVLQVAGPQETVDVTAAAGYQVPVISSATKTPTPLLDVPQAVTVVSRELMADQMMTSMSDVVQYMPGITAHQGENNRDQIIMRGNSSSADFFVNGVRDDVQYFRDVYNLDRVEALKGPNALMFGRGGGGGVINRVVKEAGSRPLRELSVQAGGYDNERVTTDLDQPLGERTAVRFNGMYESSGSFRDRVNFERGAVNPTFTFSPSADTRITAGYEHLRDDRVADRGITSFEGRPARVDPSTYYGDPDQSKVRLRVNLGTVGIEHRAGGLTLRNRTMIGGYDRFYQNFVPGPASADASTVRLSAYNNASARTNVFNQSDVTFVTTTGPVRHTLLAGAEVGHQSTDNFRNTGYFDDNATAIQVPFAAPTIDTPVTFRQSATDADNHVRTNVAAAFAQDQVELSRYLQVIGGVRFDRFDLRYHDNRGGDARERVDRLVSPRAGIVVKPVASVSLYTSYSVSFLPSSGDQFSSLTAITEQVKPEKFDNYEIGAKWELASRLALTSAVYRLDRTNTRATDPTDPTRIIQTGSQRTNGFELGINGEVLPAWRVAGGYANQDAFVTSATVSAREGAQVAQVPHHTFSLWNNYRFVPAVAAAVGVIHRSAMFAGIDNTVVLPGYTRVDAAIYVTLRKDLRLQINAENLSDTAYFINADGNTNISPGAPRTIRFGITAGF